MNATINQAPAGIVSSAVRWARRNFDYSPLLILLGTGVFLRVALMILYFPDHVVV